jgi:hypothetical protein
LPSVLDFSDGVVADAVAGLAKDLMPKVGLGVSELACSSGIAGAS